MDFVESLKVKIKESGKRSKIVYPDGAVETCVEAVSILCGEGIITPIILGDVEQIKQTASKNGWSLDEAEIIDPKKSVTDDFIDTYFEKRKHKGIDKAFAKSQMEKVHFYGAMMVEKGLADGMVGGLTSDTKPFIPAFEPNIAFLSFSTFGTATDPLVDKVEQATKIAKALRPEYNIDGEMQFDSALLPAVAEKKCPNSPVAGKANVFIFPDLNAGNIGYKITERLGGYDAVGPIFQGLNKPANDLSRGAKPEDIANSGYLTVVQTMAL